MILARCADLFGGKMKALLLVLFFGAAGCFLWFSLLCLRMINFDKGKRYKNDLILHQALFPYFSSSSSASLSPARPTAESFRGIYLKYHGDVKLGHSKSFWNNAATILSEWSNMATGFADLASRLMAGRQESIPCISRNFSPFPTTPLPPVFVLNSVLLAKITFLCQVINWT